MSGANDWTLLGPDCVLDGQMHLPSTANGPTISGRVTCLALAEGRLFVGTAGGGLWMSDDADGRDWTPLTDHLACHSIGALAYDAEPTRKRLWIGSGEGNHGGRVMFGQGLYTLDVATASGAAPVFTRFTNLPAALGADAFRSRRTTALLLEPNGANPPIVWWATNAGLFRSIDSGANWVECDFNGSSGLEISSLVRCQTSAGADRLLAAVWGDRIYSRVATGTSFTPFIINPGVMPTTNIGGRIGLVVAPSNLKRVYCVAGVAGSGPFVGVFSSTAGGENWARQTLPTPTSPHRPLGQSQYNLALAVHPTDPDTLMFGETSIWRSKDGGATWADLASPDPGTHSDQHAVLFDPADPTRVWFGNDGGVWLSTNGGDTMAARNRGLATLQYYALVHHPSAASVLLAGAQDNGTQRYAGSPGWGLVGDGDGFYCGIDPSTPSVWYSSYVYRQAGAIRAIMRSDNAGGDWHDITTGIDPTEYPVPTPTTGDLAPFFVPFITTSAAGMLFLGTTRLWRSTDRGNTWLEVRPTATTRFATAAAGFESAWNSISCLAVDPNDNNTIHFGTVDGRLFRCHIDSVLPNGQPIATFTQARATGAAPLAPRGYVTDVAVPKLAGGAASQVVYMVLGSDYLAFTNTTQSPLPDGRVWKYDYTPGAPADWTQLGLTIPAVTFPTGPDLPPAWNFANAIAIDPNNAQRLFVGCHMGVFESTNGGAAWARYGNLPNTPVVDLQLHPTHRLLRAATMGRSIWERPIDVLPAPNTTADIYIRDNLVDVGRFASPLSAADPLATSGNVAWFDGIDLKVDVDAFLSGFDTPASTVDYLPGGAIDYIGFEKLRHHELQRGVGTRAHLRVINRGPQPALNVKARVYWAAKLPTGNFPPLHSDFWTLFPDGALPVASQWQAAAASQTVARVEAGEPTVFTFSFDAPDLSTELGLFAVITCDNDPISETRSDVELVTTSNKHTALRKVALNASTGSIVAGVLVVIGMAAVITGVALASAR